MMAYVASVCCSPSVCFGLATVFPPVRIGWTRGELFCAVIAFFDSQRDSHCHGGWSREGRFEFPREPGTSSSSSSFTFLPTTL